MRSIPALLADISNGVGRSMVALYTSVDREAPRGVGTGLLFTLAGERFVVSAQHVLGDVREGEALLAFNSARNELVTIGGRVRAAVEEVHDIAVLHLDDVATRGLAGLPFATQGDIDTEPPSPTDLYGVVGFPIDPQFRSTKLKAWRATLFVCVGALGENMPPLQTHDQQSNIVMEVDPNTLLDGRGAPASLPSTLKGISGGVIVRAPLRGGGPTVIAVETSIYSSNERVRVKGTYWRCVLGLIDDELHGIQAVTRLALPRKRP